MNVQKNLMETSGATGAPCGNEVCASPSSPTTGSSGTTCATCDDGERAVTPKARLPEIIGWGLLALVVTVVLGGALAERLGLLEAMAEQIPWPVALLAMLWGGWPVFRSVVRAARQRRITASTLMSTGVLGALIIGDFAAAAVIVFFMRFANWLEEVTTASSRQAIRQLTAMAPDTARVVRDGVERMVPVQAVQPGDAVVVRPGERIPVDGLILEGEAPVDQASITGESMPVDKQVGDRVFAATIAQAGWLKIQTARVGSQATFGRIVHMVEEAETRKAPIQRFADRFSSYYLPIVLVTAVLTLMLSHNVTAAVAVLVVSCSCAIAIATPVAVLAAVGRAAWQGILVKGGLVLEQLARVDTVVFDKTGTLTLGRPQVTNVVSLGNLPEQEILRVAFVLERRSEHPLARAIVEAAEQRGFALGEPETFMALPGRGVAGRWEGQEWLLGSRHLLAERDISPAREAEARAAALEEQGKTVFFLVTNSAVVGLIAVADVVRPGVREAVARLRQLGISRQLLLTGDTEWVAATVARSLELDYRANQLPEDKIATVLTLQAKGRVVLMVGDGVNDAPALAQADVGVAMGATCSDIAIETAAVAIMQEDFRLVPEAIRLGRRTASVIRRNLFFTVLYNATGIALAASGVLPLIWAAAAQVGPDVVILGSSAFLLWGRHRPLSHTVAIEDGDAMPQHIKGIAVHTLGSE